MKTGREKTVGYCLRVDVGELPFLEVVDEDAPESLVLIAEGSLLIVVLGESKEDTLLEKTSLISH